MTFTKTPPRRIFFWCDVASRSPGGETPLVDFRRVWSDLRPPVRERFLTRGLKIIRNYAGPGKPKRDLLQLKRWNEMFLTTDKDAVSARARAEGFEPTWHGDRLTLTSEHEVARKHPESGELVWFNHAQVFHLSTGPSEPVHLPSPTGPARSASGARGRDHDAQALDPFRGASAPLHLPRWQRDRARRPRARAGRDLAEPGRLSVADG
jgi:hypothetical protein